MVHVARCGKGWQWACQVVAAQVKQSDLQQHIMVTSAMQIVVTATGV